MAHRRPSFAARAGWVTLRRMLDRRLILVKHALPELQAGLAPRHWQLGAPGRAGAKRLSDALRRLGPVRLEHSPEPKAAQTAEVVQLLPQLSWKKQLVRPSVVRKRLAPLASAWASTAAQLVL